jgi:ankyrin repeat protein
MVHISGKGQRTGFALLAFKRISEVPSDVGDNWLRLDTVNIILNEFPDAEIGWLDLRLLLISASESGHSQLVETLIKLGTPPDWSDQEGWSPLMSACRGGHIECARRLLENGADVNAKTDCGDTALMEAVASGNPELVEFLLQNGADVNIQTDWKSTPLFDALRNPNPAIIGMLLRSGADPMLSGSLIMSKIKFLARQGQPLDPSLIEKLVGHGLPFDPS